MKKFFLVLVSLSFSSLGIYAQQKKAAYIYRNDNAFDAFACTNIDSITYETSNERDCQVIWTADSAYRIPLESIDSVCFDTPKNIIFQIPEEDLNGWEIGYSLGDEYVVAYTDESDSSLVMMVNKNGGAENGLIARFNAYNEMVSIGDMNKIYDIKYEGNDMILYRFNEKGLYEETVISLPASQNVNKAPRKLPSWNTILNVIENLHDYIGYIQSGITIGTDVMKEDWKGAGIEAGWLLVGIKVNPLTGAIITYLQSTIEHYINQDKERKLALVYNNCEVVIDEVKPEGNNRVIYATVTNANNLPDYLFRAFYDHEFNEQTRNLVSCGIVVRKDRNNVTTHLNDFKSQLMPLNGDGTAGSVIYLSFTIPELDAAPNFTKYYLKPYLTSSRLRSNSGNVDEGYIKYGEIYEYECPTVEIDSITKKSCKHYESSSEYLVEVSVEATIEEDLKGVTEWGVAFYSSGNNVVLLGEVTTSPNKTSFTFDYRDFLDESFFDKKSNCIKLIATPFAKGSSNNEKAYGKAKEFEISIVYTSCPNSNHPHMIDLGLPSGTKWACCNVGASSPEEYGGYYAWGETEEKGEYTWLNYAYYNSSTGEYTNIGSDIAGTQYDVAHVKWGRGWHMPTFSQIQELLDNTTSEWTSNGVAGMKFTGSNGGTVFLPAAGDRWYPVYYNAGLCGSYWLSTLDENEEGGAYGLLFVDGLGAGWSYNGRYGGRSVRPVR